MRIGSVECSIALNVNQPILQRFDYHTLGSVTLISSVTGCIRSQLAHAIGADCQSTSSLQVRDFWWVFCVRVDTEKGKYSTLSLYPLLRDSYRATILEVIGYAPRLLKTHEIVNEREFCFKNGFREPENLHFPSHHVGCSVFLTNHRL